MSRTARAARWSPPIVRVSLATVGFALARSHALARGAAPTRSAAPLRAPPRMRPSGRSPSSAGTLRAPTVVEGGGRVKGVVFTELMEMLRGAHSMETIEELLDACELPSGGAYTTLGTYDVAELHAILDELGRRTSADAPALLHTFGRHLFHAFRAQHPRFFADVTGTLDLLRRVEDEIHVEVRKLYPEAELPSFACSEPILGDFILEYRSSRGLADLAAGLIDASIEHHDESLVVERRDLSGGHNTHVIFNLRRT
ncbi:MAG: heme NO-binding domain-containing protein [Nannocystaceae bacterium]